MRGPEFKTMAMSLPSAEAQRLESEMAAFDSRTYEERSLSYLASVLEKMAGKVAFAYDRFVPKTPLADLLEEPSVRDLLRRAMEDATTPEVAQIMTEARYKYLTDPTSPFHPTVALNLLDARLASYRERQRNSFAENYSSYWEGLARIVASVAKSMSSRT